MQLASARQYTVRQYTVAAHVVVLTLLGVGFGFAGVFDLGPATLLQLVSSVFLAAQLWLIYSWRRLAGSIFNPYGLFLLAAELFHGGQVLLERFGLNAQGFLANRFDDAALAAAITFVTLSLAAFHLGACLSFVRTRPPAPPPEDVPASPASLRPLRYTAWTLLLVALPAALLTLSQAAVLVLSSGYLGLYQGEKSIGLASADQILSAFLVPGAILLMVSSRRNHALLAFSALLMASYSLVLFFLGIRGWAVLPLIAYAWVWHRMIAPLPKTLLFSAGATALFVVFPFVKVARAISGQDRLSLNYLWSAFLSGDNPVVGILSEFGYNLRTVAYTLKLVPSARDFDFGQSYLYALTTAIPNLFWELHPAKARGTPGDWLVQTVEPVIAAEGGGIGFSFIAEAYLNFGWLGGLLGLALLGYGLGRLSLWGSVSTNPLVVASIGTFMSFFLFYSRSDLHTVFRSLVWYVLIPVGLVGLYRLLLATRQPRPAHLRTPS